jgi:hypothetical protein
MYRDPEPQELNEPLFECIWQAIKSWDINVPSEYVGYCGATGNHVCAIMDAVRAVPTGRPLHPPQDGQLSDLAAHAIVWELRPETEKGRGDEIRLERRDGFEGRRWAVTRRGWVLNKQGDWEYEPIPSSRTEEWLKTVRWNTVKGAIEAVRAQINCGGSPSNESAPQQLQAGREAVAPPAQVLADDILRRIALRYRNCLVNIYPDLPELTPVEGVLRCAMEEGFVLRSAATTAPPPDELLCASCGHSYGQHTKGINPHLKFCRHCTCAEWQPPSGAAPSSVSALREALELFAKEIAQIPVELHGIRWSSKTRSTSIKHDHEAIVEVLQRVAALAAQAGPVDAGDSIAGARLREALEKWSKTASHNRSVQERNGHWDKAQYWAGVFDTCQRARALAIPETTTPREEPR